MAIADRVKKGMASGSVIRKLFEEGIALKKIYGNDKIFDLTLGNPMIEPPEDFDAELKKLVNNPWTGMHRYMENAGYTDTRAAVAGQLTKETGVNFTGNEVIMTCGAAGAINLAFKTLLNPGEEVIAFGPFFFEYSNYAENHGGVCTILPFDENFAPDFDALEAGITARTKAIVINSPNNPTGTVYTEKVLKQLTEVATRKSAQFKNRIYIVSDDVYSRLYYGKGKCPRMVSYYPHTILATSYSKALSLPGERIGYVAVHPECEDAKDILNGMIYANRVLGFVNAPALMQNVIRNLQNASVNIEIYQRKRDLLYDNLTKMGYSMVKPEGAFYMFPKSPIPDEVAFINELKNQMVLAVPGSAFRAPGYFRICFCLDDRTLEGSLPGLQKTIEKYRKTGN